ncbi:MAG: hypothetical protein ACYC0X_20130 [Pirellulaceae bacterium]
MTINPEKQHDENQQTTVWPEEVSNEGHVYVALGVSQQEIDIWMQRELELAQQEGNFNTVAALNAANQQRW